MRKNEILVRRIRPVETQYLRHKVLWPHIIKQEDCVIDIDNREDGFHLGAFVDDRLVSIASFFEMHSDKIQFKRKYRLRAMATDPDFRRMGTGKAIIKKAILELEEMGVDVLWCNARKIALDFYLSIGFEVIDEWYDIPMIGPHKFMYYRI